MILHNNKSTYALGPQKKIGIFDYPFSLNPYIGCEMQCSYCFVPGPVIKTTRKDFFENVQIKVNFIDLLKKELKRYAPLPQHLKRVQIGVTTEIFQPKVINHMEVNIRQDILKDIFDLFLSEWNAGNKWMLHILTKNHNILSYLDQIKDMREMVQVEFSIIHHDENISRQYEKYTSSIKKRLDAIKKLSSEDLFVRVMAMPFYGDVNDLNKLKSEVFNNGAKAFKNKDINYYQWGQLKGINPLNPLVRSTTKTNSHIVSNIIKSGESTGGKSVTNLLMPKLRKRGDKFINWAKKPKDGLSLQSMPEIDMGYSLINNVDWGYII